MTAFTLSKHTNPSREEIYQALQNMNDDKGKRAIQGASGRISFGPDDNPEGKMILVLYADANHITCVAHLYGKYQEDTKEPVDPTADCKSKDTVTP